MLRTGAVLLSLWTVGNLLLALGILFSLLALGKNAPALLILYGTIAPVEIDPRALATINALAVVFNAGAASLCGLSLTVIWAALVRRISWAFWAVTGALSFIQAAGFASDAFLGNRNLTANLASSFLLLAGFSFAAVGIFKERSEKS